MNQFAAVIFDLDGVLIDSEPLHAQAWEKLFTELGLVDAHGMDFRSYIGVSDQVFLRDFLDKHPQPATPTALNARKRHHLLNLVREKRPIFPELHELIPALAQRYRLAVASSSNQSVIDVVLTVAGFRQHFSVTVGGDAVHDHKPDPAVYNLAVQKLGVSAAQCCAIEDSTAGITAAQAAGITVIGYQQTGADHFVHNFTEVRQLLL
ncbi:MAG: HAD family phosphatase [Verrucomicrobiota bacterium]